MSITKLITVFADASWSLGAGGYAYWARNDANHRVQGSAPWPCSGIHEAETVGLSVALMEAIATFPLEDGGSVILQSDSLIALGTFYTLGFGMPAKTSDRPIAKLSLLRDIPRIFVQKSGSEAVAAGAKIWLKHIKGHTNNDEVRSRVNAWCDAEAKLARKLCAKQLDARKKSAE